MPRKRLEGNFFKVKVESKRENSGFAWKTQASCLSFSRYSFQDGQSKTCSVVGRPESDSCIFLSLSDTVANNVYLLCEFSVTQVSSRFLWILDVSFCLTMSSCVFVSVCSYICNSVCMYHYVSTEHLWLQGSYELTPYNGIIHVSKKEVAKSK